MSVERLFSCAWFCSFTGCRWQVFTEAVQTLSQYWGLLSASHVSCVFPALCVENTRAANDSRQRCLTGWVATDVLVFFFPLLSNHSVSCLDHMRASVSFCFAFKPVLPLSHGELLLNPDSEPHLYKFWIYKSNYKKLPRHFWCCLGLGTSVSCLWFLCFIKRKNTWEFIKIITPKPYPGAQVWGVRSYLTFPAALVLLMLGRWFFCVLRKG